MTLLEKLGWTPALRGCGWEHRETGKHAITLEEIPVADRYIVSTMREYGGHFVTALAEAWVRADPENQAKISSTWPEYWLKYKVMGLQSPIEDFLTLEERNAAH